MKFADFLLRGWEEGGGCMDIHCAFFDNVVRGKRAVSRTSSGKFLRVESCYPESFGFLRLCIKPSFNLFVTLTQDIWIVVMEVK